MNPADQYLYSIIATKKSPPITLDDWRLANIKAVILKWGGSQISELKQSGSSAKGTALKGVADVDIFISLKSDTTQTLKELFNLLDTHIKQAGIATRRQDVSIRVTQYDLNIDLTPGKKQSGYQNYHSIYSSKRDTWLQTNIDLHVTMVKNSGRQNEIILTKIWRQNHGLSFPSIYLELIVLDALKNKTIGDLANNFYAVLTFLRDSFVPKTVIDPANTNNIISETLYLSEKQLIAGKAKEALLKSTWREIIW